MEYAFSILMFAFAGALLLYALILGLSKDIKMVPRSYAAQMKNPKAYARRLAQVIALTAAAPALSALDGLFRQGWRPLVTLFVVLVICLWIGVRMMKDIE